MAKDYEKIIKELLPDNKIDRWWFGNWGNAPDKREIIRKGLANIAADFHNGSTITTILYDIGFTCKTGLNKSGRRYLFYANEYAMNKYIDLAKAALADREADMNIKHKPEPLFYDTDSDYTKGWKRGFQSGWNDCLNAVIANHKTCGGE